MEPKLTPDRFWLLPTVPARYRRCRLSTFVPRTRKQEEAKGKVDWALYDEIWEFNSSLIFVGPCGVGKSHLAVAYLYGFADALVSEKFGTPAAIAAEAIFISWRDLMRDLTAERDPAAAVARYERPLLLLVDDLEPPGSDREAQAFAELIDARYRRMRVGGVHMAVTTNLTMKELRGAIGDRAFDRLMENAYPVVLDGKSYRQADAASPTPETSKA